jgi:hypothetical protein
VLLARRMDRIIATARGSIIDRDAFSPANH